MTNIFRYKFDAPTADLIKLFSTTHKYDDPGQFKEEWDGFIMDNKSNIDREKFRLVNLGYTGDVDKKMYKSARYYFKNKSTVKKEIKQRRKYVTLDKEFLADMDRHITSVAFQHDMKPVHAYNNFVSDSTYSNKFDEVIKKLVSNDWKEPDAENKLKKTYKNRYFIQQTGSKKD